MLVYVTDGLGPIAGTNFSESVVDMRLDCGCADIELVGDVPVGHSHTDQS